MIDFSTLQGLTIPEGAVAQIADASGRVLWAAQSDTVVLEVEKITSNTYVSGSSYTDEQFILLDIYPKTNGTVNVTYGGVTKTITDTSGAESPNSVQVYFGTYGGASDGTPASGTLKITGDCAAFACSTYTTSKTDLNRYWTKILSIINLGAIELIPSYFLGTATYTCDNITSIVLPKTLKQIEDTAFVGAPNLTSAIFKDANGWVCEKTSASGSSDKFSLEGKLDDPATNATYLKSTYSSYVWTKT